MKYRLRDKRARNEAIRRYRQEHPEITMRELAGMYNVSQQRINQILRRTQEVGNRDIQAVIHS